jgi:chemotaxis protein methyltransferase CheR
VGPERQPGAAPDRKGPTGAVGAAANDDTEGEGVDPVEAIEMRLLLEAIHARYGYDLREYTAASVRRRVHSVLARSRLDHLGELQHRLLHEPDFFAQVIEDLTISVSEMFRDPSFFRAFRTLVIPILRTYPLLNFWHAGCARGEEAYSNAILLSQEGLYERSQLYATDMSVGALEHAKQGIYPADRVPIYAANHEESGGTPAFSSYYTAAYDQIALNESLRRNILFFQHNLASDHVFGEMHVIFCRNVLIYFGPELRARVLEKFAQSLCPGGFLCLGSSERLPRSGNQLFSEFSANERIYRLQM